MGTGTRSGTGARRGATDEAPSWLRRSAGAVGGARWWTACALAALALASFSTLTPHRVWGVTAAAGYAVAAWLSARRGGARRPVAHVVAVAGAVPLPLLVLLVMGRAQLEVDVIARSAGLLLSTGSPYLPHPAGAADFNPYLPGMAVLGIPDALSGGSPITDPRLWTGAAFLGALALSARGLPLLWIAACPVVALPLAVGGVDLPVVGLLCLGLASAGRGEAGRAGLVLGLAAALKWTAWPALPVALALLLALNRRKVQGAPGPGAHAALRCGATAVATSALLVLPAALRDPGAFATHVVAFPLGLTDTVSAAASPLPGHLLAAHLPGGRAVALALLAVSALGTAASLCVRPPVSASAAALRLALGLLMAIAFMPASRFGYVVYPLVLAAWAAHGAPGRTREVSP
ncbi:glycosyltransferase 87 family protein [Streptomyces sp. NBC_01422]|uniref:glycosyltransferase 87 family protein n=1 Tax=Streptomyces sp. NBC_01422 TaxID=2903859 RepID=UPI003FCDB799